MKAKLAQAGEIGSSLNIHSRLSFIKNAMKMQRIKR
jgi:hypothetical protein